MGLEEKPIFYFSGDKMRKPINVEVSHTADGASTVVVKSIIIKNAKKVCIQRMSATNETTNSKSVTFGVQMGVSQLWFESVALTTAGQYYPMTTPVFLSGSVQLLFKFHIYFDYYGQKIYKRNKINSISFKSEILNSSF